MLPVSQTFLNAVRGSHQVTSSVKILTPPFVTGTSLVGTSLNVIDGSVTLDATAQVRGTADITVKAPWPTVNDTASLVPYGTELQVTRGIVYANGASESAPLGIFMLTDVEQDDAPYGPLRLTMADRMQKVIDSKLTIPIGYSPTNLVGDIVNHLILGGTLNSQTVTGVYPNATIVWDDTSSMGSAAQLGGGIALASGLVAEQDRYAFITSMLTALGKVWYWDYAGKLQIKTPPANNVPVWFADAGHSGVLTKVNRSLTRSGVANVVVIQGTAMNGLTPPIYTLSDTDPNSVTYVNGAFGVIPYFYSDPSITPTTIVAAAQTQLNLKTGLPYSVNFSQVPNPALEPYDCVQLVYPIDITQQPNQKYELHYLQQVIIGLGFDTTLDAITRLTTNKGVLG